MKEGEGRDTTTSNFITINSSRNRITNDLKKKKVQTNDGSMYNAEGKKILQ